ncbi:MAG: hypothetical protein OXC53_09110, partial [Rhodobacteraceae bacterium]|nr:hypothetical protein [Paracoccaceae bacterium]
WRRQFGEQCANNSTQLRNIFDRRIPDSGMVYLMVHMSQPIAQTYRLAQIGDLFCQIGCDGNELVQRLANNNESALNGILFSLLAR